MSFDDSLQRPRPNQLRYRLYGRALHPEWLTLFAWRRVRYAGHTVSVGILAGGHVLQWHRDDTILTEVLSAETDLPAGGLLLDHAVVHGRRAKARRRDEVRFETESQVEFLAPDIFRQVHGELVHDGASSGLVFHFPNHGRVGLGPLGFLTVHTVPAGLVCCAFHTFPDQFAVVKTQSLIDFASVEAHAPTDETRARDAD